MAYVDYATIADVALFMGVDESSLPTNISALISRASDLITNSIIVDMSLTESTEQTEVLKLATSAQVEYWITSGTNENSAEIQSYSAGSVSVTYREGASNMKLSYRARAYLNRQGLLYRGVKV